MKHLKNKIELTSFAGAIGNLTSIGFSAEASLIIARTTVKTLRLSAEISIDVLFSLDALVSSATVSADLCWTESFRVLTSDWTMVVTGDIVNGCCGNKNKLEINVMTLTICQRSCYVTPIFREKENQVNIFML